MTGADRRPPLGFAMTAAGTALAACAFGAAMLGAATPASWLLAGGIALLTGGMFALRRGAGRLERAIAVTMAVICLVAFVVALLAPRDAAGTIPAETWWTAALLLGIPGVVLPLAWRRLLDRP